MNKKGQGLPMNTVVMAILVIVVLILVLTFFFGGFTGLTMKIRQIFFGSLAGTSETLAVQNCNQYCNQLQLRSGLFDDKGVLITDRVRDLAYCRLIPIDTDEDGQADKNKNCEGLYVDCKYTLPNGQLKTIQCPGASQTEIKEKTE
jgi:hypothetical protein